MARCGTKSRHTSRARQVDKLPSPSTTTQRQRRSTVTAAVVEVDAILCGAGATGVAGRARKALSESGPVPCRAGPGRDGPVPSRDAVTVTGRAAAVTQSRAVP